MGVTAICPGMINTAIVADGRMAGEAERRKTTVVDRFRTKGAPPSRVAEAILDAVRTNPAVRTVGRDAWVLHQLTKVAPRTVQRVVDTLQRRAGAG